MPPTRQASFLRIREKLIAGESLTSDEKKRWERVQARSKYVKLVTENNYPQETTAWLKQPSCDASASVTPEIPAPQATPGAGSGL
jgi:hypothetical protein